MSLCSHANRYCGVGCAVDILSKENKVVGIQPAMDGPANEGALCIKGQYAFDFVNHPDRLQKPMIRKEDGSFREAEWEEAAQAGPGKGSEQAVAAGLALPAKASPLISQNGGRSAGAGGWAFGGEKLTR